SEIKILNTAGQILKSIEKSNKIDISKLPNGIYILNGVTDSGEKATTKFIKS
ncbi:MAG: hypothetical protein DI529_09740, partial [Chryseobacterium sp.]